MHFSTLALIATLATFIAATPVSTGHGAMALRRAIDRSFFTEEELADLDPEKCCCCRPVPEITNLDVLHKIIAASQ